MGGFLLNNAPLPITDRIARPKRTDIYGPRQEDKQEGLLTDAWADYLSRLAQTVQHAATRIKSATNTEQSDAIAPTDISGGSLSAGFYRVGYYARVTTAAGVSSSFQVTISWTDGGVAQSMAGKNQNGNTTSTVEPEIQYVIHIDDASPVSYSVAYASNPANQMEYRLDVFLEVIQT